MFKVYKDSKNSIFSNPVYFNNNNQHIWSSRDSNSDYQESLYQNKPLEAPHM